MVEAGTTVVWRCHVGLDLPNETARETWEFLRGYVAPAHAYVFSRREHVWAGLAEERIWIVAPSIDAFSPKNQELTTETVEAILARAGLGPASDGAAATFERFDGSPGRVDRAAEIDQQAPIPGDAPLVVQVSRWDRAQGPDRRACRASPSTPSTTPRICCSPGRASPRSPTTPRAPRCWPRCAELRAELPSAIRERVHLACLPMDDVEENAAIVNAIQRRAQVVVQKSLAEGFGLTVAEAMWKARPMVASRAGGIQDQIIDGETGVLLDDPRDLARFGTCLRRAARRPRARRERSALRPGNG